MTTSREQTEGRQRARMIEALALAAHKKGAAAISARDVVRGAGVSTTTFYAAFADKDACLMAGCEASRSYLVERSIGAAAIGADGEKLERLIAALVSAVASEPVLSELYLVHSLALGRPGWACFEQGVEEMTAAVSPLGPTDWVAEAFMRGMIATVGDRLRARKLTDTEQLGSELVAIGRRVSGLA